MAEVSAQTAQYSCTIAGQSYAVVWFSADEGMSRLYRISLSVWSDDPAVSIAAWIRKPVVVKLAWGDLSREYHGLVVSACRVEANQPGLGGVDTAWGQYTVEVAPSLWLLSRQANCKVFQDRNAVDIIKAVLDARGMAGKYELRLSGSYPVRTYCVQYRETDFAFISRLMEEEGIFYYFTHEGQEMMVIGDSTAAYSTCSPQGEVEYRTPTGALAPSDECLSSIVYAEGAYTGKVKYKDFNYRLPTVPLRVEQLADEHTDLEIYDYHPERYLDDGRGRALAKVRAQAESARSKSITATGTFRSAGSGCKLTSSRADHPDLNREWLVTAAFHSASQQAETGVDYSVTIEAIPASTTFRAYPATPKPSLAAQTATIVGPKGEKIYMDELGRAKVQFDWDRDGKLDEDSSCWIRVAMPYAGIDEETQAKHGFQWHPLIGDEVVVSFLENDPDRPLITGSVYNANKPPIVKPEELIESVILTPYQHRIVLDDKECDLAIDTGFWQQLWMKDKDPEHGFIQLETMAEQKLLLEDSEPDWGNLIELKTCDNHEVSLFKGKDGNGIYLGTEKECWLDLDDEVPWAELATPAGHYLNLCDAKDDNGIEIGTVGGHLGWFRDVEDENHIKLKTAGGRTLELSDTNEEIYIEGAKGGHLIVDDYEMFAEMSSPDSETAPTTEYVYIDWELHIVEVVSHSGTVTISGGQVEVKGGTVNVTADGDLTVKGKKVVIQGDTVEIQGSSSVSVSGGAVSVDASSTLDLSGQGEVNIKGAVISSEASGINNLKGSLVKIN